MSFSGGGKTRSSTNNEQNPVTASDNSNAYGANSTVTYVDPGAMDVANNAINATSQNNAQFLQETSTLGRSAIDSAEGMHRDSLDFARDSNRLMSDFAGQSNRDTLAYAKDTNRDTIDFADRSNKNTTSFADKALDTAYSETKNIIDAGMSFFDKAMNSVNAGADAVIASTKSEALQESDQFNKTVLTGLKWVALATVAVIAVKSFGRK